MKRINSTLWIFGFCLIALLWVPIRNYDFPEFGQPDPVPTHVAPEPAPTDIDDPNAPENEVLNFCKDPRHFDSVVCSPDQPSTTTGSGSSTTQTRTIRVRGADGQTRTETRIIERERNNSRVEQRPAPQQPPPNNSGLDVPNIPEVVPIPKVPEVVDVPDVPEVDVPMVGKVDVDKQLDPLLK